jgi:hypothetical protein
MTLQTATEGDRSGAVQRKRITMCVKKTITRFRAGAQQASSTALERSAKQLYCWPLFLSHNSYFNILNAT